MKKIIFLVAFIVASMHLAAQSVYQKLTSTPNDWTGTYLIVCESQSVAFNGAADKDDIDAKGGNAIISNITITDGQIAGTETLDKATFTISKTGDEDWPWAIQSASGLYIGHKDSIVGDNGLSVEEELKNKCKHTLEIDEDGNWIATPRHTKGVAYHLQYNKKADQLRFRYFLPEDKQAIQLYKLNDTPAATENITHEASSQIYYINGQLMINKNGQKFTLLGIAL